MEINEVKDAVKEVVSPLSTKMDGIESRIKAIEDLEIIKTPAIIMTPKEIHGRKIAKQGAWFRKQGMKEEVADGMVKMLLGIAVRKTALNETTDGQGGYLVPDEYAMEMVKLAQNTSFALQVCRVMDMGSDRLLVPTELTRGTATWEAEGATKTASEPTFGQAVLSAKKLFNLAVASQEVLADSAFDISSLLAEQFAYTQAQELDNQLFNGTGDPVSGVLTASAGYSVALGGISFSAITALNISEAISKIEEGYLGGSRFFFNRATMHYVRSLKDSQNRPIFAELGGNVPNTLYQYPVNMSENIVNTDGTGKVGGVFGNFDKMIIGRRAGGMMIESDPYSLFTKGQVQFRMISRWAFAYGKNTAFARFVNA